MDNTVDEEVMVEFRRFPKDKQDQIQGLVNYATLMGLSGKDLISIGGRLERVAKKREMESYRAIVEAMDIRTIGKDKDCSRRWAYKDSQDTLYYFSDTSWYDVTIKNTKTGKQNTVALPVYYDLGRYSVKRNRDLAKVMLNVYFGHVKLP